jgi:hypothetical protein
MAKAHNNIKRKTGDVLFDIANGLLSTNTIVNMRNTCLVMDTSPSLHPKNTVGTRGLVIYNDMYWAKCIAPILRKLLLHSNSWRIL